MQVNPHELKEKLLKALDKDQNVVDVCTVLDVFTKLERFPITRETLEQTRIGRTVNDLRKKTKNKDLAKRAKNLVRRWQVLITPTNNNSSVNGEGLGHKLSSGAGPPGSNIPPHVLQGTGCSKPVSPASRPDTPQSGAKSNNSSPALVRPNTPASNARLSPKAAATLRANSSNTPALNLSPALMTSTPVSQSAPGKSGSSNSYAPSLPDTPRSHLPTSAAASAAAKHSSTLTSEASSKTRVANKRRRRDLDNSPPSHPEKKSSYGDSPNRTNGTNEKSKAPLVNGISPPEQNSNGSSMPDKPSYAARKNANLSVRASSVNTPNDVSSPLERLASSSVCSDRSDRGVRTPLSSRTPKVKTTAQLLKDLASRKDFSLEGCETVAKIAQNRIEKEHEEVVSIVPAGAKPRPRRTPAASVALPNISDVALTKTKNEMVQKFLESSVSASQTDLSNMLHFNGVGDDSLPPVHHHSTDHAVSPVNSSNVDSGHVSLNSLHDELAPPHPTPAPHKRKPIPPSSTEPSGHAAGSDRDPTVAYLIELYPHISGLSDKEILRCVRDDPYSLMPAACESTVTYTKEDEEVMDIDSAPVPVSVPDSDVEKLHTQEWEGVNGHTDPNKQWQDWTHTCSMPTYNADMLHILPYVEVDTLVSTEEND